VIMEDSVLPTPEELLKESGAPSGDCDAGCGRPARTWFGLSSCASCGSPDCIEILQDERDNIPPYVWDGE
jgi:hypothetical protein